MIRVYRLLNLLSLDVAVGAVITALFFAELWHAPIRYYGVAALGLTVWIIYTTDRLIDVRQLEKPAVSERHKFHQKHDRVLWIAVGLALVAVCILGLFIRPAVLLGGLTLAPLVGLYLLLQKKLPTKELVVATGYTLGVLLPAWPGSWSVILPHVGVIAQLFLLALTNLLLFAWFEASVDQAMGQHSLATRMGKKIVARWILVLIGGGILSGLVYAWVNPAGWITLGMWLALAPLYAFPSYFGKAERYRLWGDAIFYLPAIGLLLNT